MKKTVILIFTILGFSLAFAQNAVGVNPPGLELSGQPGQTLNATISLDNPGKTPLTVVSSLSDWYYNDKGEITFLKAQSLAQSATGWITVTPVTQTVPANQHGAVRYSVKIPPNTKSGSYWAIIFFEGRNPNPPVGGTLATFNVRVGYIVYVNVGKTETKGRIGGVAGARLGPGTYQFAVQFNNTGNRVVLLNGKVLVRNANGDTVVDIPIKNAVALPGAVRLIKASMLGPLPAGPYSALVLLNDGSLSQDIAGQYTFQLRQPLQAPKVTPKTSGNSPATKGK